MYTSKTQFEDQQRSEFLSFLDDVLQEENPFEDKGGYLVAEVAGVSLSIEIEVDNWDELPDVSAVLRKIAVGTGKWTLVKSVWVDEDGAEEVA
ncbi:MAG: hypothetical protein HRU12_23680, partial [Phaeodactylibacter sp.]|nr:hypothetical protein [Phaeodactylibacter sp.]